MIDRSIWKFLRRIGLTLLLFAALPAAIASAQAGMGGEVGSMDITATSQLPLKVVIMLGTDYDFSEPPFINASDVLNYFNERDVNDPFPSSSSSFSPPIFDTVDVDVETDIPSDSHKRVVAVMSPNLNETDKQKFKRKIQLIALRFGINRVETIANGSDTEDGGYPETIWLRVPFINSEELQKNAPNYADVAVALANALDDESPHQPRIDIYQLPQAKRQNAIAYRDPFALGSDVHDPFGGGGDNDPFGDPGQQTSQSDRYATNQPTNATNQPPKLSEPIQNAIVRHKKLLQSVEQKARNVVQSEQSDDVVRELLTLLLEADYKTRTDLQKLELRVLETKLEKIRDEIRKRESADVKQNIIEERVQAMMLGRND